MRDLQGENVLITGAAGGLGRELCYSFGSRGAKILALDLNEAMLAALNEEMTEKGIDIFSYVSDISDNDHCGKTIQTIIDEHRSINIVIQNAGISHRCSFKGMTVEVIQKILSVNINGTINVTHHTLDNVIENKGTYVVVSSVAGFAPLIGRTIYATSKHALHGFFESLRGEVEDLGVKIMIVCPSFIKTPLETNAVQGDGNPVNHQKQTVGNVLTPQYVAETIYKGVRENRRRMYISPVARLSLLVSRMAPNLYTKIMKRKLISEIK